MGIRPICLSEILNRDSTARREKLIQPVLQNLRLVRDRAHPPFLDYGIIDVSQHAIVLLRAEELLADGQGRFVS